MKIAVLGGTGFIGHHVARRLLKEGHTVVVYDYQEYKYGGEDFATMVFDDCDLRKIDNVRWIAAQGYDEVYCFACQMGGAGYVFTGENDSDIMSDSALININILKCFSEQSPKTRLFYSSSACIYPEHNQLDPWNPICSESSAYPANPDSEYGWEKIFSERLFKAFAKNKGLEVRIARFHNIYGVEGTWKGGREKAPAATCRKVLESNGEVEVWGTGQQTRSFLYIDDCVEGIIRLMRSDYSEPLNIGSEEMISINDLTKMVIGFSGKDLKIKNVDSKAIGVNGRNSDNKLIREVLGWEPTYPLEKGMKKTYEWIKSQYEL